MKHYKALDYLHYRFQFGICEDTPMLAEARLFQKIGEDAKKWKFEVREVTT